MENTNIAQNGDFVSRKELFICFIGLAAICFSIILRIEPSMMQSEILRIFHVPATTFSDLAVRYQYSLLATLLFAGVIVDFFGPRTVLTLAIGAAVIGNCLFVTAKAIPTLIDGRILIGYAHPFILISVLKLGTLWLPRRHFAFFAGLLFAILLMTPVLTKDFLTSIVSSLGMRTTLNIVNFFGLLLIAGLITTSQEESDHAITHEFGLHDLRSIITNKKIWLICLISIIGWLCNTFLLNYGTIYFVHIHHFTHDIAADTVGIAFACFALGAMISGIFADLIGKKQFIITMGYLFAALLFSVAFYTPSLTITTFPLFIFASSFCAGTAVICYAKAYTFCTQNNAGSIFALIAFMTTLGNVFFTLELGNLLQHSTINDAHTWQRLFLIIPIALTIGGLAAIFLHKKTTDPSL